MTQISRRAVLGSLAALASGLALMGGCGLVSRRSPQMVRLGFLSGNSPESSSGRQAVDAFRTALRQFGWVEGQNLTLELRYADGHDDRLRSLAAELVQLPVDVLVAAGTDASLAARDASHGIPVVLIGSDPVGNGLVTNLAHPGGYVTGVSNFAPGLPTAKLVELLYAMVPALARLAVLLNADYKAADAVMAMLISAAAAHGIVVQKFEVRSSAHLEVAFGQLAAWQAQAVYVVSDSGLINASYETIASLALRGRLASISGFRPYVEVGGLMSYGPNVRAQYARAAYFVDRILHGQRPGDLPIEQPTAFEFVVNAQTAQALRIAVPPEVAAQVTDWLN